jgi:hypothetical protein
MDKSDPFPLGNATVGDSAWYRTKRKARNGHKYGPWVGGWKVVKVGLKNKFGYRLKVRIRREKKTLDVDTAHDQLYIFPPSSEYKGQEQLVDFLNANPTIRAIRNPGGTDVPGYQFICMGCKTILMNIITQVESAELKYHPSNINSEATEGGTGFYEGQPSMEDCQTASVCECKGGAHGRRAYDVPEQDRYT